MTKNPNAIKKKRYPYYGSHPWRREEVEGRCELVAFVDASQSWERVAIIQPTSAVKAEAMADFILRLVNERHAEGDVLQAAFDALDGVLQEGLNFTTEQDVERVMVRLKRRGY